MKISVLVIAHNEEKHIAHCIESILGQDQKPYEVILIAHNCVDKTAQIAKGYPEIIIHELTTKEKWPLYARKYGFKRVWWDIIACIDGDAIATSDWLQELVRPFKDVKVVATWWRVWFYANWRGNITSFLFSLLWAFPLSYFSHFYFWWASFACRRSSYLSSGGFEEVEKISENLQLNYSTEDCILSFLMKNSGKIVFVHHSIVYVYPGKFFHGVERGPKQRADFRKIYKYFQR